MGAYESPIQKGAQKFRLTFDLVFLAVSRGESEIFRSKTMDFHRRVPGGSPSSSTSSTATNHHQNGGAASHHSTPTSATAANNNTTDPMHSWWESISKARARILLLADLLPESSSAALTSLDDSERPARSLLLSSAAYLAVSAAISGPNSGSGDDPFCHWLYDTFLSGDPDLRLVVLSYIPLISSLYLSRIHSSAADIAAAPSLAGFEAVLLALYSSEVKSRAGKPVLITIPDLSQPSLYHSPRNPSPSRSNPNPSSNSNHRQQVGVLSPPLEAQMAVKSTKRACIVGIGFDCYYKQISQMPSWSKLHFCQFATDWAGQECPCTSDFDDFGVQKPENFDEGSSNGFPENVSSGREIEIVAEEIRDLRIIEREEDKGVRIPLPWELLQPVLRILGHCLLGPLNTDEVKDAASLAVRRLYARASHELNPQGILATRSLIQLDRRSRDAAAVVVAASVASASNTPSKAKKPEMLLVSK